MPARIVNVKLIKSTQPKEFKNEVCFTIVLVFAHGDEYAFKIKKGMLVSSVIGILYGAIRGLRVKFKLAPK